MRKILVLLFSIFIGWVTLVQANGNMVETKGNRHREVPTEVIDVAQWLPDGNLLLGFSVRLDEGLYTTTPSRVTDDIRDYKLFLSKKDLKAASVETGMVGIYGLSARNTLVFDRRKATAKKGAKRGVIAEYIINDKRVHELETDPKYSYFFVGWGLGRRSVLALEGTEKSAVTKEVSLLELDLATGKTLRRFLPPKGMMVNGKATWNPIPSYIVISPDAKWLALAAYADRPQKNDHPLLYLVSLTDPSMPAKFIPTPMVEYHSSNGLPTLLTPVVWSANSRYFITGCADSAVCRYTIEGKLDKVYKYEFSEFDFRDYYAATDQVLLAKYARGGRDGPEAYAAILIVPFDKEAVPASDIKDLGRYLKTK